MRGLGRGVQCRALEFRLISNYKALGAIQSGVQLLHPCFLQACVVTLQGQL